MCIRDRSNLKAVVPPHHPDWFNATEEHNTHTVVLKLPDGSMTEVDLEEWFELNQQMYQGLRDHPEGKMKKEDARQVLPIATKSQIVVKANVREWRHIFKMRCDHYAHWEIRRVMLNLLRTVKREVPLIFDDFKFFMTKKDQHYARIVMTPDMIKQEIEHYLKSGGDLSKIYLEGVSYD